MTCADDEASTSGRENWGPSALALRPSLPLISALRMSIRGATASNKRKLTTKIALGLLPLQQQIITGSDRPLPSFLLPLLSFLPYSSYEPPNLFFFDLSLANRETRSEQMSQ